MFLGCIWACVGQPRVHIGWATKDQFMKFSGKNIENWRSWKMRFFWGGHFEFFKSAILNFFLLHISEKPSPFILGIIFFCTMDGFSRILEKKGGGLLCTRLYFASLSLLYQFKCGKKFMLQNIPFSCLNAINYIYSLAAGINVFTEKRNGLLRQSFLLFPLWQTAVFGRFTSPGIDQTAVQWDQTIF